MNVCDRLGRMFADIGRRGCLLATVVMALWLTAPIPSAVAAAADSDSESQVINGTTGAPLGGFGAGGIKFNANDGTFAAMLRPPADAYDFKPVPGARFHLRVDRGGAKTDIAPLKARIVNGRPMDDAAWPIHRVDFGSAGGVSAKLLAVSPFDRKRVERMCLPCVLYEVTLTNEAGSQANVQCVLEWQAGAQWAVASDEPSLVLDPGESRRVRFVVGWTNDEDPGLSVYQNLFATPRQAAELGMAAFDELKANAERVVEQMRQSNLPGWLKAQTLSTLSFLTTNSMYKRDGRVAFAEGQWTCFGTMDQMWHARLIVDELLPEFAWKELRFWARTQKTSGQIHHDFNLIADGKTKSAWSALVPWDDHGHADYRKIDKWVDLNCAFIVSVFELYRATGNMEEFEYQWPHVKKAAQRILDQVEEFGDKQYPYTFDGSENSYDAGGEPDPFNASLSAVAYRIMVDLARERDEPELARRYQAAYDGVVKSYRQRYLADPKFPTGQHCEAFFAGQWLSLHLKLGEIWTAEETDKVLAALNAYYQPYYRGLGYSRGTYDEWTPYLLVHYGGLLLNTGHQPEWRALQFDAYERQFLDRNRVFAHPLDVLPKVEPGTEKWVATDVRSKKSYMSLPALWRNYADIVGYTRDVRTKEVWLEPIVLDEMNHAMKSARYFSPESDGVVDCIESAEAWQNRALTFRPDSEVNVSRLRVTDTFGEGPVSVAVNGKPCAFERVGSGYARELSIAWSGKVGAEGLHIVTRGSPGRVRPPLPVKPTAAELAIAAPSQTPVSAFKELPAAKATKLAGVVISEGRATSCNNFDYVRFDNVDFGRDGATTFSARVKGLAKGATIEVTVGSESAEPIGVCAVPTGTDWSNVRCAIRRTVGRQDVVLKFAGASEGDLLELQSVQFLKDAAPDGKSEQPVGSR